MMYDIILSHGRIIDIPSGTDFIGDIAISGGRIAKIASSVREESRKEIDCSGLMLLPGLIDMHTHVYPIYPRTEDSLPAFDGEAFSLRSGVTTCVDAGTCGIDDFPCFLETVIRRSKIRILAFLNIARGGMVHLSSEQDPSSMLVQQTAEMAAGCNEIVGIKSAHYRVGIPFDDIHTPWLSIDRAIEAGEISSLPVMVDMQPNGKERTYRDFITKHLRPGDIHAHVFAQQFDFLDEKNHVMDYMFEAKERGIRFDLGHGRRSFWFRKCIPSLLDGFYPDDISTDIYSANVLSPVQDMMCVMSKMHCAGMPLKEVIAAVTCNPAMIIGHRELGCLREGGIADIAAISIESGDFGFEDGGGASMKGSTRFSCELTIKDGKILYDRNARSCPDWRTAPHEYWIAPSVIGGGV